MHKRRFIAFDDKIVAMYTRSMTSPREVLERQLPPQLESLRIKLRAKSASRKATNSKPT